MLFYASLLIFCIVVSAIGLWLYRSVGDVAKAAYIAFLPSSRNTRHARRGGARNKNAQAQHVSLNCNLSTTGTPWGWSNDQGPRRAIPEKSFVSTPEAAGNGEKPVVGWPYREEQFAIADRENKVTRKRKIRKTNIGGKSKPWGW